MQNKPGTDRQAPVTSLIQELNLQSTEQHGVPRGGDREEGLGRDRLMETELGGLRSGVL
jgi:hypothetical protein